MCSVSRSGAIVLLLSLCCIACGADDQLHAQAAHEMRCRALHNDDLGGWLELVRGCDQTWIYGRRDGTWRSPAVRTAELTGCAGPFQMQLEEPATDEGRSWWQTSDERVIAVRGCGQTARFAWSSRSHQAGWVLLDEGVWSAQQELRDAVEAYGRLRTGCDSAAMMKSWRSLTQARRHAAEQRQRGRRIDRRDVSLPPPEGLAADLIRCGDWPALALWLAHDGVDSEVMAALAALAGGRPKLLSRLTAAIAEPPSLLASEPALSAGSDASLSSLHRLLIALHRDHPAACVQLNSQPFMKLDQHDARLHAMVQALRARFDCKPHRPKAAARLLQSRDTAVRSFGCSALSFVGTDAERDKVQAIMAYEEDEEVREACLRAYKLILLRSP